jgi:hypothetical protein
MPQCIIPAGYEFWLFPNMLSDEVDILGAFKPLLSLKKPEDGQSHWGTRIGGLVGTALMVYMLYAYSPDERTIKRNLKAANENILDMFHSGTTQSIGDGTGYQPPKFGADRNIDVGSIRQHIMNEKLRKREEAARAKRQAAEGGAPDASQGKGQTTGSREGSDVEAPSEPADMNGTAAHSDPEVESEAASGTADTPSASSDGTSEDEARTEL